MDPGKDLCGRRKIRRYSGEQGAVSGDGEGCPGWKAGFDHNQEYLQVLQEYPDRPGYHQEVEGEKGDKANLWLLDCEFDNPSIEHGQEEDNPPSMSLNFFVSNRTVVGEELFFIKVPSSANAYVSPGTEPTTSNLPVPVAAS